MRIIPFALGLGCCVLALSGPAAAGDWTFGGSYSTSLDYNDNYFLDSSDPQSVFSSVSSLGLRADWRDDTQTFALNGSTSYSRFFGEGSDLLLPAIEPRVSATYSVKTKRTTYTVGTTYAYEDISRIDPTDPDGFTIDSFLTSYGLTASIRHLIDRRNTISFSNSLSLNTFSGSGSNQDDNWAMTNSISWNHLLTKRSSVSLTASVSDTVFDDDEETYRRIYRLSSTLNTQFNERLKARIGGGARLLEVTETDTSVIGQPRSTTRSIGGLLNAGFDYTLKTITVSMSANFDVEPNSDGDLRNRFGTSLSVRHTINELSSIGVTAAYSMSTSPSSSGPRDATSSLSIAPTYTRQLSRRLALTAGYRFLMRDSGTELTHSNSLFMSVGGSF
jgi:hypothetical protein